MNYNVITFLALIWGFVSLSQPILAADLDGSRVAFLEAEREYQSAKVTLKFKQEQLTLLELRLNQVTKEVAEKKEQISEAKARLEQAELDVTAKQKVLDEEWAKAHHK